MTFTTDRRRPVFADDALSAAATDALLDLRLWARSRLLAWALMPDHWHGLVELGPWETLPDLIRRLKANTSRRVRETAPGLVVWAAGYHDRALRYEESVLDAARYVVMNPVRAGLVRRVRDYRYWGAVWAGE
ncbi:transposase [Lysobacter sp. 5GHs7-4]|uniref:REP-associated tyrosine transposase n=1 Tax=Lysobacter sp. 5GHs7-4 TaxID=2904253 RepID=UPI001E3BB357|nr:transposase [Lysobacter sp. 5GHs7-4]UHQ23809.1 transposase [Lysobacter sp. 5GHs7-4]